jgi:ATP-binding cassette subfamily B protein
VELEIERGSRIGIVGVTGSGKSTLIDLIMALLPPSEGGIEIEGQLLTPENRASWQARIAHVPQTIFLSDTTIAENIALGLAAEEIDLERVGLAARQAQLATFIDTLPRGYQTVVGERGVRLSGGQRQRIGLARALYKQTDVLVLDEATSALDDATESDVMDAIRGLHDKMTVLIIAHRISTLRTCDWIIQLGNDGEVRRVRYDQLSQPHLTLHSSSA